MQNKPRVPFPLLFRSTLIAIVTTIVANNVWYVIFAKLAKHEGGPVNFISVTMGSTVPLLVAALAFYVLSNLTAKYKSIYIIGAVLLTFLSLYGSFQPQLPDGSQTPEGFALLTVPMHFIAGAAAIFIIPRIQTNSNNA